MTMKIISGIEKSSRLLTTCPQSSCAICHLHWQSVLYSLYEGKVLVKSEKVICTIVKKGVGSVKTEKYLSKKVK